MSEPNEIERVRALRAAFLDGVSARDSSSAGLTEKIRDVRWPAGYGSAHWQSQWTTEAARRYPMPMVTKPRVVRGGEFNWRILNGVVEYRRTDASENDEWYRDFNSAILERTHAINKLLQNPTVTVPADEVEK